MPIKRSSGRLGSIGGGFNNNSSRRTSDQLISSVPLVKHCIFPIVPKLSSISFLSFSLVLCLTSTLIQHMNLYQTVWWLRNTSIEYPIEFDLIDCYVITHILLMLCTPYVYLILIKFIPSLIMTSLIIRSLVGLCIFTYWGYIMTWILNQIEYSGTPIMHHPLGMVLLTYFPILTLLVYHSRYLEKVVCQNNRLQHHHHHHSQLNNTDHNNSNCCSSCRDNNTRITYQSSVFTLKYCLQLFTSSCWRCLTLFTDWPCLPFKEMFFPIPYKFIPSRLFHQHHDDNASTTADHHASISTMDYQTMDPVDDDFNHHLMMNHQCLGVTPDQTRDEVELYRRDFNARLTDIFIGTLHAVYYGCFLPIIFVQVCCIY
ncbi:unnamed protein product [Schistosoma turkestanicum]|nr:unnamed protein product [Schistosoma turkestanicum]